MSARIWLIVATDTDGSVSYVNEVYVTRDGARQGIERLDAHTRRWWSHRVVPFESAEPRRPRKRRVTP